MFDIKEELKKLPDSPGVYLHKDAFGQIIYVGKAVNLSRRVHQYFQSPKNQPPKVRKMVENIKEFEYITTGTEMEALILENNLIKKYKPKYNILLRDDKTYPYIKLTLQDPFPRVLKTRRIVNDGSKYFGPYSDVGAVNVTIDLLNSAYSLKRCKAQSFPEGFTPCLNYHIKSCRGICLGAVDKEEYDRDIEKVMEFLQGRDKDLIRTLTAKMERASEALDFEEAARFRDQIEAAKAVTQKQRVVLSNPEDLDVVLLTQGLSGAHAVLFTVREGKLSGRESFFLGDINPGEEDEMCADFIKQYYGNNVLIPKEILLEKLPGDHELISEWLSAQRGSHVTLASPMRGEKRALLQLAKQDVDRMLSDIDERARREIEKEEGVRSGFDRLLGADAAAGVHRIEAYDISHIMGTDSVGGMVVFRDGRPERKSYRRFKIKTIDGADDTASLQEVLFRRFRQAKEGNPGFAELPDLILMDGAAGQVHAAEAVLKALRLEIPVMGMAKDDKHRTRALVYNGQETELRSVPGLFPFIGTVQEEVHRFAIDYHRKLRGKALNRSVLDEIPGIGEKRKLALLAKFGSIEAIKQASAGDIADTEGFNSSVAESVVEYFAKKP